MAHRMNDDILKVILATLQRLETRFNDQDERLSTIEFSMLSEASGSSSGKARLSRSHSNCCSCAMSPAALFQGFQRESKMSDLPMATAYMASMDKLRSRFDFDEQSEMRSDYNCETHSKMDVLRSQDLAEILDAYSVSVYPSRPLSRLDMGSGDDVPEVPEIPAFRYDEATSPTDSASSHDSTSSGTNRTSLSESQRSASTAPTSITQPEQSQGISKTKGLLPLGINRKRCI
ncbi:hypothetical protein B0H63DRAFT_455716 [Podospora didyma]|uniref:Uncharacterized protein n=1 Tax=Podospora didyma TaxID=330526 RepID=A0AAE0N2D9_9PEZI|nr:hypothetical protein B0H63DRAFT_455716 [Podospora didyma]